MALTVVVAAASAASEFTFSGVTVSLFRSVFSGVDVDVDTDARLMYIGSVVLASDVSFKPVEIGISGASAGVKSMNTGSSGAVLLSFFADGKKKESSLPYCVVSCETVIEINWVSCAHQFSNSLSFD